MRWQRCAMHACSRLGFVWNQSNLEMYYTKLLKMVKKKLNKVSTHEKKIYAEAVGTDRPSGHGPG
jgi:hypothetical protein